MKQEELQEENTAAEEAKEAEETVSKEQEAEGGASGETAAEGQEEEEKEEAEEIAGHWEQIASAKELTLTQEDIQTLKDFINEL